MKIPINWNLEEEEEPVAVEVLPPPSYEVIRDEIVADLEKIVEVSPEMAEYFAWLVLVVGLKIGSATVC